MKFWILIAFLTLQSCVSLNSHQSGRTIGQGNSSFLGSFNYGYIDSEQYFTLEDFGAFYIAGAGGYYGIRNNLDVGIKVNSSTHFSGISKFQFIGSKQSIFASSVGFDIGVGPLGLPLEVVSYSGSLSIYNSIHFTEHVALTVSPRYTYLGFNNFSKENKFSRKNKIFGYSTGLIVGAKHQLSFEISQFVNNKNFTFSARPIISIGYIWNLRNKA